MKDELIPRKGNYRQLISYQKAEAIYDMTSLLSHKFSRDIK